MPKTNKQQLQKQIRRIFVCQFGDRFIKVAACAQNGSTAGRASQVEFCEVAEGAQEAVLAEALTGILKKLGYAHEPMIVSVAHNRLTSRYVRIPAQSAQEIENIVSLQAVRFLPCPPEDLVAGYQVVTREKEGYSGVLFLVVYREVVERYVRILQECAPAGISITASSIGLSNYIYACTPRQEHSSVVCIEADAVQFEIAVSWQNKVVFARHCKIQPGSNPPSVEPLVSEITKTLEAYDKEFPSNSVHACYIAAARELGQQLQSALRKHLAVPVELCESGHAQGSRYSAASLLGLGCSVLEESANLLPREYKKLLIRRQESKKIVFAAALVGACLLFIVLGMVTQLANATSRLHALERDLKAFEPQAAALDGMDRKLKLVQGSRSSGDSVLDIIKTIRGLLPEGVSLTGFTFEEKKSVTVRGFTHQLNDVFKLAADIEANRQFRRYKTKIRYASKRRVGSDELIEFEIGCSRGQ